MTWIVARVSNAERQKLSVELQVLPNLQAFRNTDQEATVHEAREEVGIVPGVGVERADDYDTIVTRWKCTKEIRAAFIRMSTLNSSRLPEPSGAVLRKHQHGCVLGSHRSVGTDNTRETRLCGEGHGEFTGDVFSQIDLRLRIEGAYAGRSQRQLASHVARGNTVDAG